MTNEPCKRCRTASATVEILDAAGPLSGKYCHACADLVTAEDLGVPVTWVAATRPKCVRCGIQEGRIRIDDARGTFPVKGLTGLFCEHCAHHSLTLEFAAQQNARAAAYVRAQRDAAAAL